MLAAVFSNVSKETLGLYRGTGGEAKDADIDDTSDRVCIVCGDDDGELNGENEGHRGGFPQCWLVSIDERIAAEFESRPWETTTTRPAATRC